MNTPAIIPQTALKFAAQVQAEGRVEVTVPLEAGSKVLVFVVEEPAEGLDDLLAAAQSSTDFWDNPLDDEDWNNA